MKEIHIDIETYDTESTAALHSIGAVCGDKEFYVAINPVWYMSGGVLGHFTSESPTIGFHASNGTKTPGFDASDPVSALTDLAVWIDELHPTSNEYDSDGNLPSIWAAGSLDYAVLHHHFGVLGVPEPWKFYQWNCLRTLRRFARRITPEEYHHTFLVPPKEAHHALHDAVAQKQSYENIIRFTQEYLSRM